MIFLFKQKTAYGFRISDWSVDVCSSDLPIWRQLPKESSRVYRLQTDDGERIIGRRVSAGWVASVIRDAPSELPKDQAWQLLQQGEAVLHLAEGQVLRRVRAKIGSESWRARVCQYV